MVSKIIRLVAVMCMGSFMCSQAETKVNEHCYKACNAAANPSGVEQQRDAGKITHVSCMTHFQKSNRVGSECRAAFTRAAIDSCMVGCNRMISGVPVRNSPELSPHRSKCNQLRDQKLKAACHSGIQKGTDHYSVIGRELRAKVDQLCASPAETRRQTLSLEPTKAKTEVKTTAKAEAEAKAEADVKEEPKLTLNEPDVVTASGESERNLGSVEMTSEDVEKQEIVQNVRELEEEKNEEEEVATSNPGLRSPMIMDI